MKNSTVSENTRFKYVPCPICGYKKSEDWFASGTWYCPKCKKSNIEPGDMDELYEAMKKRNRELRIKKIMKMKAERVKRKKKLPITND